MGGKREREDGDKDISGEEGDGAAKFVYVKDAKRYEELKKQLDKWNQDTREKYKNEKQEQRRFESVDEHARATAGWMRESGGVAQTEHPIWVHIQDYAKDERVKKLLSEVDVLGDKKTQALLSALHDHWSLGLGGKKEAIHKHQENGTLHDFYNCCGDIGLHMVFLNAYIFSFEEDGDWYPHRQLIRVGKYLIESNWVDIDAAYCSDLEVWKSLLDPNKPGKNISSPSAKDLLRLPSKIKNAIGEVESKKTRSHITTKGHVFSGLYTGETVLHMAIVFADEQTVEWLLKKGASLRDGAKATGAFFMPRVVRRGHLDDQDRGWWREWKTDNNIQSDDDVVGNFNPLSAHSDRDLYFGQYPLSFAASQGHDEVCKIIRDHVNPGTTLTGLTLHKDVQDWHNLAKNGDNICQNPPRTTWIRDINDWDSTLNHVDDLGNTPLHIAVMHARRSTFDWLLENGAKRSLRIMNKQGLTPFTLAVWLGDVEMYTHFANGPLCTLLWKYGAVDLKLTDLEQIDTFRTRSVLKNIEENEKDLANAHIHAHPSWRSAFEIIVEKELKEFTNERIFDHLVMSKWDAFGRVIYFFRVFVLYIVILIFFFAASMIRISTLKVQDRKPQTGLAAFEEDDSGIMWIILSSVGIVLLGNISWILLRVKRRDLDKDHDGSISTEEAMMFLFKNLGSLCGFVACILFVLVNVCRSLGWDEEEHALIACTSVIMFCNVLPIVTAFKYIGVLVLTTYRMLISDIARFILVYIVMLTGFSTAMYVLFDTSNYAEALDISGLRLTDFGSVMRKMLYISLGEVGSLDREMNTPLQLVIYFVWVVLTNVLLLNLLISMMGQTFSDIQGDTHNAWVFPVANFILRCESHIQSRRWRTMTRSGKRGSNIKEEPSNAERSTRDLIVSSQDDTKDKDEKKYQPYYPWPWPFYMTKKTFLLCKKIKREHRFTELRAGIIEENNEQNNVIERLNQIQDLVEKLQEANDAASGKDNNNEQLGQFVVHGRTSTLGSMSSSRSASPALSRQGTISWKKTQHMNDNQK